MLAEHLSERIAHSSATAKVAIALGMFVLWTLATWVLEGRRLTLLRPEAWLDRATYAVLANLVLGILVGLWVHRRLAGGGFIPPDRAGFRARRRTAVAVASALALGVVSYLKLGSASTDPVIAANVFAQVFAVSAAEVIVCWVVVGATIESALRDLGRPGSTLVALVSASIVFGLYHFGHSPPFNTWAMVGFLTIIGLLTGAFYFAVRDVYGTIVFHNFLATIGVLRSLEDAGLLSTLNDPAYPLFATALIAVSILASADR
ncbi:MAG: hypothetical protein ACREQY_02895, partial [Candidatus Binatia bacterium]